jgi:hypothetical protein
LIVLHIGVFEKIDKMHRLCVCFLVVFFYAQTRNRATLPTPAGAKIFYVCISFRKAAKAAVRTQCIVDRAAPYHPSVHLNVKRAHNFHINPSFRCHRITLTTR